MIDHRPQLFADKIRRPADFSMREEHHHNQYELFYMVSGRCRIFVNHTIYHMKTGDMLLIEPLALHRTMYGITQENERVDVMFGTESLEWMNRYCGIDWMEQWKAHPFLKIETGRRSYVENLFQKLIAEQQKEDLFSAMMRQTCFCELMVFIGRQITGRREGEGRQEPGADLLERRTDISEAWEQEEPIQRAARYIYTHFDEQLTLDTMAEMVHMSPTYFSRRFRQITGFGFKEYINFVRIKEASKLLLETSLPLNVIARRCGFSDSNYFGDLFKKEKGISPRMYRKNPQILP